MVDLLTNAIMTPLILIYMYLMYVDVKNDYLAKNKIRHPYQKHQTLPQAVSNGLTKAQPVNWYTHTMNRCTWVKMNNSLYVEYHDKEWAVPVYDDQKLFEFITLEGAQAGLTWNDSE